MKTKLSKSTLPITLLLVALIAITGRGQSRLDQYIQEGLQNNLALQNKNITLRQAEQSLEIARSYFLPSVQLLADYTTGKGGRTISMPVGDLLNPVYATLNKMTQSDKFPQIENVDESFFPRNFYDARIRTSLPLINTDLQLNRDIRGQEVLMRQHELDAYKRQLVMDIKVAYYNFLSARAGVKIYESARELLTQNVAVNESLYRNGKNLPANIIRSKSELESVNAELNSARNQVKNAQAYFNFLLNRDQNAVVETDSVKEDFEPVDDGGINPVANNREEIQALKSAYEINKSSLKMKQLGRLPKVSAFLDLGSQASDWQVDGDSRYYLAGVQLTVPLFQGFRTNRGIRQDKLELEKTERLIQQTTQQLELAASVAYNDLHTAVQNHEAASAQLEAAESYFRLVAKGYREGVNTLIEFIDARNQLTTSQLTKNQRLFEIRIAAARLERESASYTL